MFSNIKIVADFVSVLVCVQYTSTVYNILHTVLFFFCFARETNPILQISENQGARITPTYQLAK